MYEIEMASDYPGYDGPSVENGFLEPVEDDDLFELDDSDEGAAFDEWLEV